MAVTRRHLLANRRYELMGFKAGDEKLLYAPLDWVGFHYYTRRIVSDASKEEFLRRRQVQRH